MFHKIILLLHLYCIILFYSILFYSIILMVIQTYWTDFFIIIYILKNNKKALKYPESVWRDGLKCISKPLGASGQPKEVNQQIYQNPHFQAANSCFESVVADFPATVFLHGMVDRIF